MDPGNRILFHAQGWVSHDRNWQSSLEGEVWGRNESLRGAEGKAFPQCSHCPWMLSHWDSGASPSCSSYSFLNCCSTIKRQDKRKNKACSTWLPSLLSCGEERSLSQEVYCLVCGSCWLASHQNTVMLEWVRTAHKFPRGTELKCPRDNKTEHLAYPPW